MQMTPRQYYDLIDACAEPGCPVCLCLLSDIAQYIDAILYQYIAKGQINDDFLAGMGLCNRHSWQMLDFKGRALGVAVLSELLVNHVLKIEDRTGPGVVSSGFGRLLGKSTVPPLAAALEPTGPCVVCEFLDGQEGRYVGVVVSYLDIERFMTAFEGSTGLCIPHARMVIARTESQGQVDAFLTVQRPKWEALRAELREFIRKYDINNVAEEMGEEGDSWKRAIRYLNGEDGIFGLRRG